MSFSDVISRVRGIRIEDPGSAMKDREVVAWFSGLCALDYCLMMMMQLMKIIVLEIMKFFWCSNNRNV